jgi:hypothetical protein
LHQNHLKKADAIVVAEGYATAATLKSLHAETGDPLGRVAFVAADRSKPIWPPPGSIIKPAKPSE